MQKRQGLLKVLAFLHFRDFSYSPFYVVREAGLEPARPEWTLEPESSESANSTTRAFLDARLY